MRKKGNEQRKRIVDFMNKHILEKGYPPSVREICKAVGLRSTSTVHSYLRKLEEEGIIVKDPTKPRAIRIVDENYKNLEGYVADHEIANVPIVGRVTAGKPILAVENIEDTFPIPVDFLGNSTAFILKIKGDSMVNAGILDGDYVIVRQDSSIQNGDIVVALIGDEATVKTYYKEDSYVRLQPENDDYEPIIVQEDLLILGKVIGVFRYY